MKRLIDKIKYWLEAGFISLVLIAVALIVLSFFRPAFGATDYHNHYLSQQISLEELSRIEREADEAWISEHGDAQDNATTEQLEYMQNYTAHLQATKNKENTP